MSNPPELLEVLDQAFDVVIDSRIWLERRMKGEKRGRAIMDMKGELRRLAKLEESLNYWRRALKD